MGGIRKADRECTFGLDVGRCPVPRAPAQGNLILVLQAAPGRVHGVGRTVRIICADN